MSSFQLNTDMLTLSKIETIYQHSIKKNLFIDNYERYKKTDKFKQHVSAKNFKKRFFKHFENSKSVSAYCRNQHRAVRNEICFTKLENRMNSSYVCYLNIYHRFYFFPLSVIVSEVSFVHYRNYIIKNHLTCSIGLYLFICGALSEV